MIYSFSNIESLGVKWRGEVFICKFSVVRKFYFIDAFQSFIETFSKYPSRTSPIWNLLRIFNPMTWLVTFICILSVAIFFFVSTTLATYNFGNQISNVEIVLFPFRQDWPSKIFISIKMIFIHNSNRRDWVSIRWSNISC